MSDCVSQDEPSKKGFKVAHVPPAPVSMQLAAPWVDPGPGGAAAVRRGKDDRDKFLAPGGARIYVFMFIVGIE